MRLKTLRKPRSESPELCSHQGPPSKARVLNREGYKDSSKASLFVGAEDKPCRIKAKGTQIKTKPRACDSGWCKQHPRSQDKLQPLSPCSPNQEPQLPWRTHHPSEVCGHVPWCLCPAPACPCWRDRGCSCAPAPASSEDSPGLLQPKEDDVPKHRIFNNFFWTTIKMSYNGFIWHQSRINTSNIVSHAPAVPCRPHSHSPAGTRPLSIPESSAHATG